MLIVSSPLCFIVNKIRKTATSQLKTVILDYYSDEVLIEAKRRLLSDSKDICASIDIDCLPVPERRDGVNRAKNVVEDIFNLLSFLDMKMLINKLPVYVASDPDSLPSLRLYEGDFSVFMVLLGKLEAKMASYESILAAIGTDLHTLKVNSQVEAQVSSRGMGQCLQPGITRHPAPCGPFAFPAPPGMPGPFNPLISQSAINQSPAPQMRPPAGPTTSTTTVTRFPIRPTFTHVTQQGHPPRPQPPVKSVSVSVGNSIPHAPTANVWTSSPFSSRNRFLPLQADDEISQSEDEGRSTESRPTRASRIRHREESREERQEHGGRKVEQPSAADWQLAGSRRRRGARLLVGRSEVSGGISAARKWVDRIPRTTLYVDNLSATCSADDLRSFVSNLGANVVSCYKVTPRHRRGRDPDQNRSAFRLCVASSDMEKVLDPTAWPDCITISEWFYIDPAEHSTSREKRSRYHSPPDQPAVNSDRSATPSILGEPDDMETTVIYTGSVPGSETSVKSSLSVNTPEDGVSA